MGSSLFDRLKKERGTQGDALQARLQQQGQSGGYQKDTRIWKHTFNTKGVTENIIRFLPIPQVDMAAQDEGRIPADVVLTPVALQIRHQFQGPNGWYVKVSPQTFGEDDPVRDHDRPLWVRQKETNDEVLKTTLKNRLPSNDYYANILVIKDGTNPENNGKVMLYKFGNAVKKLLDAAQNPAFESDPKIDPFNPWEGSNLILNMVGEEKQFGNWKGLVGDFKSGKWADKAPIGDDSYIEEVWGKAHSLYEFYDHSKQETYEQLEAAFRRVMNIPADQPLVENAASTMAHAPAAAQTPAASQPAASAPATSQPAASQPVATPPPINNSPEPASTTSMDEFDNWLKE